MKRVLIPATSRTADRTVPTVAQRLGYAGLLPQMAVVTVLVSHDPYWRFAALSLGYAYAALILSFLGGLWWGLAARQHEPVPAWVWIAAVMPSLIALASALPWAVGAAWPGPSLALLGIALIASLAVDVRLTRLGLAPSWWMRLRIPLSAGLGLMTLTAALL